MSFNMGIQIGHHCCHGKENLCLCHDQGSHDHLGVPIVEELQAGQRGVGQVVAGKEDIHRSSHLHGCQGESDHHSDHSGKRLALLVSRQFDSEKDSGALLSSVTLGFDTMLFCSRALSFMA